MKDFDRRFERAFPRVAFLVNRHLIDHLRRCARELDADFESTYIWGLLAHLSVAELVGPEFDATSLSNEGGDVPMDKLKGIRLSDLALISGLPRETVRRKLAQLSTQHRVIQDKEGLWRPDRRGVDAEVRAFTKESTRRLLVVVREVEHALHSVQSED